MQTRFNNGKKHEPNYQFTKYTCTVCSITQSESEKKNIPGIMKNDKLRPQLVHVVGNIYTCLNCKTTHLHKDFSKKLR